MADAVFAVVLVVVALATVAFVRVTRGASLATARVVADFARVVLVLAGPVFFAGEAGRTDSAFFAATDLLGAGATVLADAACREAFGTFPAATSSLKPAPGRKAGTDVFFTLTGSPVRGLRAVRAARSRFSNTPKPVMVTFSPLVTAF